MLRTYREIFSNNISLKGKYVNVKLLGITSDRSSIPLNNTPINYLRNVKLLVHDIDGKFKFLLDFL